MDKFEQQFENLDVQSSYMETAMSDTTTLTVPQVEPIKNLLILSSCNTEFNRLTLVAG